MSEAGFAVPADGDRSGSPLSLGPNRNTVKVSAADTDGRLAVFEYEGATLDGPPLHVHDEQDEVFFVRDGTFLFRVGDADYRLGPGETIFLPRGLPHSFRQLSSRGRLLYLFQPAGDMEAFFDELATVDPAEANEASISAVFARHGMRVVGPPLPAQL